MTDLIAAVDLTTVATSLTALLVLGIGIKMAFKGSDWVSRVVKKV